MAATIISPVAGSTIYGPKQTFNWTYSPGAVIYQLWIGSAPNSLNLSASGYVSDNQATIDDLPADGSTIYATVYEFNGITWIHNADYSFINAPAPTLAFHSAAAAGGSITPSGITVVSPGDSVRITVVPDPGYYLYTIIEDGVQIDPTLVYERQNITVNGSYANFYFQQGVRSTQAFFQRPGATLTFTRNPVRHDRGRGFTQAKVESAGAERVGRKSYAKNDILELYWPSMSTTDKDLLLAWWSTTVQGMARSFNFFSGSGIKYLVRFAKPSRPDIREKAFGMWEVKIQLRVL